MNQIDSDAPILIIEDTKLNEKWARKAIEHVRPPFSSLCTRTGEDEFEVCNIPHCPSRCFIFLTRLGTFCGQSLELGRDIVWDCPCGGNESTVMAIAARKSDGLLAELGLECSWCEDYYYIDVSSLGSLQEDEEIDRSVPGLSNQSETVSLGEENGL
jgi:hypothetical protein